MIGADAIHETTRLTRIAVKIASLGASGPNLPQANGYEAVRFGIFRTMLHVAAIDASRYAFVDYGCGKERALLPAAESGFESVIGVELANSERAYRQRPRNLVVACRNPVHAQVFDEAEFLRPVVRNRMFNLYRSGGPEKLVPAAPV